MMGMRALLLLFTAARLWSQPQDALSRGQDAFQAGDLARAESLFRQHLKAYPSSAEALSNLGAVLARREQFSAAIALYQRALRANPQLTQIYFNLGVAQVKALRFSEASGSFRQFLKAYPDEARARQLLGLSLLESGDYRAGIAELEAVGPADASMQFALAYAHARAGDPQRGEALLRSLESNPAQAALLRGLIHYRQERFADARVELESALKLDPDNPAVLAALARCAVHDQREPEAIAYFERALARNASDAESTFQLGVLMDRASKPDRAMELWRRALTLRANYPDPHYQLARVLLRLNRPKEALAEVERAARLAPDHGSVILLRGRIYQALGQADKAKADMARVQRMKAETLEAQRRKLESEITLQ
jgi:tetratricopeptide (TPR) repeat protein